MTAEHSPFAGIRRIPPAWCVGLWIPAALCATAWAGPERYTVVYEPAVGEADPRLPAYKPPAKLEGKLHFAGAMSLRSIVSQWVSGFQAKCPDIEVDYAAVGSRNATPSFAAGDLTICVSSRPLAPAEVEEFQKNFGYQPVELVPAMEVWAVYVHKDNPVRAVTLAELDGLWSSTRARGGAEINRWGELGCTGERDKPVNLYACERDLVKGPIANVLAGGRLRTTINFSEDTSAEACEALAKDPFGAAFGRAGLRREFLRPLLLDAGGPRPIGPTHSGLRTGDWPLVKKSYMYVHKKPGKPLDPVTREFLRFVFSKEGQDIVLGEEKVPHSREGAEDMLKLVE